jgi:hypothetical protein
VRRTIALAVAGLGLAAAFLPVAPASAVCAYSYQLLTGHCDPCPEIAYPWNVVNDASGDNLPSMRCD